MNSCSAPIPFKAGGTFLRAGTGFLPAGTWTATSQVRSRAAVIQPDDNLVATLTVALAPTGGAPVTRTDGLGLKYPWVLTLQCPASDTVDWPAGPLDCDVKFTDATGIVRLSQTFQIACSVEVTRV